MNLALRQQLSALKRRHPRPRLVLFDRLFWLLSSKTTPYFAEGRLIQFLVGTGWGAS